MSNTHYTLIIFITYTSVDWRLYEHDNDNGSCVSSAFQISLWNKEPGFESQRLIQKRLKELFHIEYRQQKLKRILNECKSS